MADKLWHIANTTIFAAMIALIALVGPSIAAEKRVGIKNIRFGVGADGTRLVIDSDQPLTYSHFTLAGSSYRLVLDFPRVRWAIGGKNTQSGLGWGKGLISRYRYAHGNSSTSRLVFDLDGPVGVKRHFGLEPNRNSGRYRLVFDLRRVSKKEFARNANLPLPQHRPTPPHTTPATHATNVKPVIVIDPGHGGRDPGAIGARGSKEKDINLSVAKSLAKALRSSRRYVVHLTRSTDEFVQLEERVKRARNFNADLFISLHADSGPRKSLRGASVYTLSAKGERRADALRKRQDWTLPVETDTQRKSQVKGLLVDLIKRETKNQSALFAQKLIASLKTSGWPSLRRTHRNAGFFVLLAPDVPAVLLEMGFLTNAADEARLASRRRHKPLVSAISASIDAFFAERDTLYLAGR